MEGTRDARLRMSAGEAKLVPPNFSHQVSFSRRQFSLARIFFFGTTLFFGTTVFFSARPGQVTAVQYYCSGMEHTAIVIHRTR